MIKSIHLAHAPYKANWIDQFSCVVGYDNEAQCCEEWDWFTVDKAGKEDTIDFTKAHFGNEGWEKITEERLRKHEFTPDDCDITGVELLADDTNEVLGWFVFVNCHNGWYYHDFSLTKGYKPKKEDKIYS